MADKEDKKKEKEFLKKLRKNSIKSDDIAEDAAAAEEDALEGGQFEHGE
ncbi:hypothetical protein [Picrophilus oshimae]|uniref:Uncharacterized protein n=1 Tax=Picrophilus torridus (strain ATCC 700027 / DSM 9790 / JCM 10055 / NBRC 100828 / KAW 2/3) TaxID=1122961 RepID=Q6L0J1_PICTO|nr:hypothetical protein [Picrophilus oshimae]AAT43511.1 hypothetical protein PTO0926 [Picrophilus oshimae DSM 9789]SMD30178.1 hypothetical protein SAMN02745355_0040 [Picrophilus oshimae DSM 9789]